MAEAGKPHPVWRGQLRLALVSCSVALYSAHRTRNELHFHFINPRTGNRVRSVTVDAGTDEEVSRGFEIRKDEYVLMEDADFEHARIDSSALLSVDKFVPADAIDPVYYDASYYLAPDEATGADVFVVLRDAIRKTGRVALSRLVISRRERAVAIMPMHDGLVLHTLHDAKDIAEPDAVFATVPSQAPDPAMVALAVQLVDRQAAEFDPADMQDRYEAKLRAVIEAKAGGEAAAAPEEDEPDRSNVVDLMAALKRSLGEPEAPRRKSAPKKPAGKTAKAAQGKTAKASGSAKPATKKTASRRRA